MKDMENKIIYECTVCANPCNLVVSSMACVPRRCPYYSTISSNFVCIGEEDIEFKRKNEINIPEGYLNND